MTWLFLKHAELQYQADADQKSHIAWAKRLDLCEKRDVSALKSLGLVRRMGARAGGGAEKSGRGPQGNTYWQTQVCCYGTKTESKWKKQPSTPGGRKKLAADCAD